MADEPTPPPEPRVLRDLRVLRPEPRGIIVYEWKQGEPPAALAVRSVVDFKLRETRRLLELYSPPTDTADTVVTQTERVGERIKLLCPGIPDAVLEEMTLGERLAFEDGALSAESPPLRESLTRLLDLRGPPCAEACDHPDCPALHEIISIRDKLAPPDPTGALAAPASGPGAS